MSRRHHWRTELDPMDPDYLEPPEEIEDEEPDDDNYDQDELDYNRMSDFEERGIV